MSRCTYIGFCPFPNAKLSNMPVSTGFMVDNYCHWNFTRCGIYKTVVDRRGNDISSEGVPEERVSSGMILNLLICGGIGG